MVGFTQRTSHRLPGEVLIPQIAVNLDFFRSSPRRDTATDCLIAWLATSFLTTVHVERRSSHPAKMSRESEPLSKLEDVPSSSPPNSTREKIQPSQAEETDMVAETAMTVPEKGGSDPEGVIVAHNHVQEPSLQTTAAMDTSGAADTSADPASQTQFGEEDNEYISGYKLYVALFSIICVFFLVLLDFSITATVSTTNLLIYGRPGCLRRSFRRQI